MSVRKEKEIADEMLVAAEAGVEASQFSGMTYEQGVEAALRWVLGETKGSPTKGEE